MNEQDKYKFKIEIYSPATIPMARLAKYMAQVSLLLGNEEHVHFDKLEEGSTVVVSRIDEVAVPKVEQRLNSIKYENPPEDAVKAVNCLNEMLRDDNTRGELLRGTAKILPFPGRDIPSPKKIGPITQVGNLDGFLVRIGGKDNTAHATLVDAESNQWNIQVSREVARLMAHHLFEAPLRVFGTGRWERSEQGVWHLLSFKADTFKVLEEQNFEDAIKKLQKVEGSDWGQESDPISLLRKIREGNDEIH